MPKCTGQAKTRSSLGSLERIFVSANRIVEPDDRKTRIFNDSSLHGIMARKRKPTPEEEAEDKGWIIFRRHRA